MTANQRKLTARITAGTLGLIAVGCFLCSGIFAVTPLLETSTPLILPSGETLPPEQVQSLFVIQALFAAFIAITLVFIGGAIWFFFGRETLPARAIARAAAILLLITGMSCMIWGVLSGIGYATIGELPDGTPVDPNLPLVSVLMCAVPAILMMATSAGIWLLYVRNGRTKGNKQYGK